MVGIAAVEAPVVLGIGSLALCRCQALEYPQTPLAQLAMRDRLLAGAVGQRLRGLQRTPQIAGIEVIEGFWREALGEQQRLRHSLLVQWAVEVTLDARLRVPGRLAVADNDESGRCHSLLFHAQATRHSKPFKYSPSGKFSATG